MLWIVRQRFENALVSGAHIREVSGNEEARGGWAFQPVTI